VNTYACLTDFIETLSDETNGGQFAAMLPPFMVATHNKGVMKWPKGGRGAGMDIHSFAP